MKSSKRIRVYFKIKESMNSKNLLMTISKINICNKIIKIFKINNNPSKDKIFLVKNKIR